MQKLVDTEWSEEHNVRDRLQTVRDPQCHHDELFANNKIIMANL